MMGHAELATSQACRRAAPALPSEAEPFGSSVLDVVATALREVCHAECPARRGRAAYRLIAWATWDPGECPELVAAAGPLSQNRGLRAEGRRL